MRTHIVVFFSLVLVCACAAPIARQSRMPEYDVAIKDAVVQEKYDRRNELSRCVANWKTAAPRRTVVLQNIMASPDGIERSSALLEIGGSTWPRHEYIYVANSMLRSSFEGAGEIDVSGTPIQRRLHDISKEELKNLAGRAYSGAMDGPCYFLSIKKGASTKTIAIYGSLGEDGADSFIKELLSLVRR